MSGFGGFVDKSLKVLGSCGNVDEDWRFRSSGC